MKKRLHIAYRTITERRKKGYFGEKVEAFTFVDITDKAFEKELERLNERKRIPFRRITFKLDTSEGLLQLFRFMGEGFLETNLNRKIITADSRLLALQYAFVEATEAKK